MSYASEKFWVALGCLAAGTGSIQQRLLNAWISALVRLDDNHFSDDSLRAAFGRLRREATVKPPIGDEGSLAATLLSMSDEDAVKHAEAIVGLHADVGCLGHEVRRQQ